MAALLVTGCNPTTLFPAPKAAPTTHQTSPSYVGSTITLSSTGWGFGSTRIVPREGDGSSANPTPGDHPISCQLSAVSYQPASLHLADQTHHALTIGTTAWLPLSAPCFLVGTHGRHRRLTLGE